MKNREIVEKLEKVLEDFNNKKGFYVPLDDEFDFAWNLGEIAEWLGCQHGDPQKLKKQILINSINHYKSLDPEAEYEES